MSTPVGGSDPCGCDPEKVFELADDDPGTLDAGAKNKTREHLASCQKCQGLYEHELHLSASLKALNLPEEHDASEGSVSKGVAMALPTRSVGVRLSWALLSFSLFAAAFLSLGAAGFSKPVVLWVGLLGRCWGFVVGSAGTARAVLDTAGPAILSLLALGALVDLLIAIAVLAVSRRWRAREA